MEVEVEGEGEVQGYISVYPCEICQSTRRSLVAASFAKMCLCLGPTNRPDIVALNAIVVCQNQVKIHPDLHEERRARCQ